MIRLSAQPDEHGTTFGVFTTTAKAVAVRLFDSEGKAEKTYPLESRGDGYWSSRIPSARLGEHYKFVLDDDEVPDPFARFLPFGVHGPARICAPARERPLEKPPAEHQWVIYELHVGTFTPEGTYAGAIARLDHLVDLGVNAIELMPLSAFPGERGWGYDGVAMFAPFAGYGEPEELRHLIREAHARGIAVLLDVVYNHFGPDGNYLARYAPEFFHASASTPWGQSPAYDFAPLRAVVLDNVRYWLEEQGFDGLRLDATATIEDGSVLRDVTDLAHALGRSVFFEDDRNDPEIVFGDLGADGVWADDFHHEVHVLVTKEHDGYYAGYTPSVDALAKCIQDGWTYSGQPYAPWNHRPRGKPLGDVARHRLITCIQNHDQVGNRALGARLSTQTGPERFLALTTLLLFLPTTPLLFMGQEWAATSPFLYFTDHHGELGEAVSRGRRAEFAAFASFGEQIPDPQAQTTFDASKLRWNDWTKDQERVLEGHKTMLRLRREDAVLSQRHTAIEATAQGNVLRVLRRHAEQTRALYVNFGDEAASFVHLSEPHTLLIGTLEHDTLPPHSAIIIA